MGPHPYTNRGNVWHAWVNPGSKIMCQISPRSVYFIVSPLRGEKSQILPFFNFVVLPWLCPELQRQSWSWVHIYKYYPHPMILHHFWILMRSWQSGVHKLSIMGGKGEVVEERKGGRGGWKRAKRKGQKRVTGRGKRKKSDVEEDGKMRDVRENRDFYFSILGSPVPAPWIDPSQIWHASVNLQYMFTVCAEFYLDGFIVSRLRGDKPQILPFFNFVILSWLRPAL